MGTSNLGMGNFGVKPTGTGGIGTGGIGTTNTTNTTGGFFNQPTTTTTTTTNIGGGGSSLFGKPTGTSTLFGGTSGIGTTNPTGIGSGMGIGNNPMGMTTTTNQNWNMGQTFQRSLTLPPTNFLKYEKVETLNEDIKKIIKKIEGDLRRNDIHLEQSEILVKDLYEHYSVLKEDAMKIVKYCKLINSKKSKVDFILQNINRDKEHQSVQLEKTRRNFHILKEHYSMKISIPSDYFLELAHELEEKISIQLMQISDLEAMTNLFYRKELGSFKMNSDLVEETIKSIYSCLIGLVEDTAKMTESVMTLKSVYCDLLKYCYGWKDFEVENKLRQMINQSEEERDGPNVGRDNKFMNI